MAKTDVTLHKAQLQSYFDGVGFERWSAIYGDAALSRVRATIREGHDRMLAQASDWLLESGAGGTLLDAGCGTGLFSLMMAEQGFDVMAADIAPRMVDAARAAAAGTVDLPGSITFLQGDIETITGRYNAVACFDVLVHYPPDAFRAMCTHLAGLSVGPFLFTYAPYSHLLAALHWVGGHFPQGQRRTEIQMIRERVMGDALADAGMSVRRTVDISHGFYHVRLVEAQPLSR